jgi:hypothetical protein
MVNECVGEGLLGFLSSPVASQQFTNDMAIYAVIALKESSSEIGV